MCSYRKQFAQIRNIVMVVLQFFQCFRDGRSLVEVEHVQLSALGGVVLERNDERCPLEARLIEGLLDDLAEELVVHAARAQR